MRVKKVRATVTVAFEYVVDPDDYECTVEELTLEKVKEVDLDGIQALTESEIDDGNYTVDWEIVE